MIISYEYYLSLSFIEILDESLRNSLARLCEMARDEIFFFFTYDYVI